MLLFKKIRNSARHQWLVPIILAIPEAETRKMVI
jgi:hypothetical protein